MGIADNINKLIKMFSFSQEKNGKTADFDGDGYKNRNVLVAIVKNKNQFRKALKLKFYHIPMAKMKNCEMPIKYVAIYQSRKIFGRDSGVYFYGEVDCFKTVPRYKIREIYKQSDEPYLYIKIKRWYRLPRRICADGMEEVAFSTTLPLLKTASSVSELQIRSEAEYIFYCNLLKTVKKLVKNKIPSHEDIVFGDYTVKLQGGMLYLYFCDVVQYVIGYDVFLRTPMKVVKDIFEYYPEL